MPYAEANGLRFYYEDLGSGPPLVLLNGLTGTLDETALGGWATLRPYLAERYHIVHVETRSHGRTNNPGGSGAFAPSIAAADLSRRLDQHYAPGYWRDLLRWAIACELAPRENAIEYRRKSTPLNPESHGNRGGRCLGLRGSFAGRTVL
jgi:pimeloyl-ACP methyl ester carboxylesterase